MAPATVGAGAATLAMRVAVLTLTRDRLEYSQHCFAALRKNAGCDYSHYVLDQGSTDGTPRWLMNGVYEGLVLRKENVGISSGMNELLDMAGDSYDVYVKFDNDCELLQENTLRDVAALAAAGNAILSPRILGLNNPPVPTGQFDISGERILDIPQVGGIFLAAPAALYAQFRYDENAPAWGMDDAHICSLWRQHGGRCGYVARLTANHYETTSGQHARYPDYFERTLAEGKPSL
jgi:hypothetical protein